MIHLKGESYTVDSNGQIQNRDISAVQIHTVDNLPNYTEAPWLSKHGDLYYLSFASGFPESIAYATSISPRGPWENRPLRINTTSGQGQPICGKIPIPV